MTYLEEKKMIILLGQRISFYWKRPCFRFFFLEIYFEPQIKTHFEYPNECSVRGAYQVGFFMRDLKKFSGKNGKKEFQRRNMDSSSITNFLSQ
jgi:hypothetical protein